MGNVVEVSKDFAQGYRFCMIGCDNEINYVLNNRRLYDKNYIGGIHLAMIDKQKGVVTKMIVEGKDFIKGIK